MPFSDFIKKKGYMKRLELLRLFKSSKLLEVSTPDYVDVGYFTLKSKEFKFNVHERFKI